jgi:hypothetical protein
MSNRLRENPLPILLMAGSVLAIEAVALHLGHTTGVIIIAAVAFIAVVALLVGFDAHKAAMGAAILSCFTLTWNGWYLGPLRPGDLLVLLALMFFVIAEPNRRLPMPPWWIKQLALVILLLAVLHIVIPQDTQYLAGRTVITAAGKPTVSTKGSLASANLGTAFKFIVAVFAIPLVFSFAAYQNRKAPRWLAIAFVTGAAASGWAAMAGRVGFGKIAQLVTHIPPAPGRQFGFALHPNFLAAGLTICVPLAMWLAFSPDRRERILGFLTLPGLLLGVYASGSRGGAACVVLALALSLVILPRARPYAPMAGLGLLVVAGGIAAAVPSFGLAILRATRLIGGISTTGSDQARTIVAHQAHLDFAHSPIYGVGLQVSFEAQNVYLQEVAAGGLMLFFGMAIYSFGAAVMAGRLMKRYDLAAALLAITITIAALNIFEADLTDRFYYVPAAILVSLIYADRLGEAESSEDVTSVDLVKANT